MRKVNIPVRNKNRIEGVNVMKEEKAETVELNIQEMEQAAGGGRKPDPNFIKRSFVTMYCRTCRCNRSILEVDDHGKISHTCTICGRTP